MATKKQPIRTVYTDHLLESEVSYMLPIYIARIHKVVFKDTNEEFKLCDQCKAIYGYLCGIGYNQGYNSIYPNIEQISQHLAIPVRSVSKRLATLEQTKLIKRVRTKQAGKFDSTHYWLYRPNMIDRVMWLDIQGNILKGKHYNFNSKQFREGGSEGRKADRLLAGLIENIEEEKNNAESN